MFLFWFARVLRSITVGGVDTPCPHSHHPNFIQLSREPRTSLHYAFNQPRENSTSTFKFKHDVNCWVFLYHCEILKVTKFQKDQRISKHKWLKMLDVIKRQKPGNFIGLGNIYWDKTLPGLSGLKFNWQESRGRSKGQSHWGDKDGGGTDTE